MPYLDSNIPQNIFYSALVGEVLRIARSTLLLDDFLPKACELVNRIKNQGGNKTKCKYSLKKIINKHHEDFCKYDKNLSNLLDKILDLMT